MSEVEIKYYIKTELEKVLHRKRQEQERKWAEEQEKRNSGGYCDSGCTYYSEQFLDKFGGAVGDYDPEGAGVDYYCDLGHSLGGFCKDYE